MEDIILVGYGGHAKSVADCIERQRQYRITGYTDLEKQESVYEYLGTDDVLRDYYRQGVSNAAVCVGFLGKGCIREKIYENLKSIGYMLPVIKDPSAIVSSSALIGEGTFIGKQSVVNAGARIGKMVIINSKALIEHECEVDDFSHVAVSAVLCGQTMVGKAAFVGANATIIQGRVISPHQIVPAGAVIR
ncbi:MAG: acetyltransferase [Lachnospiraceae bacterium]|nr:acetyltransferase [Lachnospiraceae bacterium]